MTTTEAPFACNREMSVDHPENVFYGTDDGAQDGSFSEFADIRAHYESVEPHRRDDIHMISVVGGLYVMNVGLDEVFKSAGFDWRVAGCSMCLGMNPDTLDEGERCASTSNRNFEGRQGKGGRTHLVSPKMAAAAAIEGRFVDIRDWS